MEYYTESGRIYLNDNNDVTVAHILFTETQDGYMNITQTYVDPELRGQNIAQELIRRAVEEIHRQGKKVKVECPYAAKWIAEHPEVLNQ